MSLVMLCRECGAKIRTSPEQVGKLAKCPKCATRFRIPPEERLEADGRVPAESIVAESDPVKKSPNVEPQPGPPSDPLGTAAWTMRTPQGETYGPVSKAELDGWVAQNRVSGQFELRQGEGPWQNAALVYPQLAGPTGPQSPPPGYGNPGYGGQSGGGAFGQPGGPNPFSDNPYQPPQPGANPFQAGPFQPTRPHRGGAILALGVVSLCTCFIVGIVGIVLGHQDLAAMERGEMDRSGHGLTLAGLILCYVTTILNVFVSLIQIVAIAADA